MTASGTRDRELDEAPVPLPAASVVELISEQIARTPSATAVVHGAKSVTFSDLDRRATALMSELIRLGVSQEVPVAIQTDLGIDLPIALLAISRAGGYYVPIEPTLPAERVRQIVSDCEPAVLVAPAHANLGVALPSSVTRVDPRSIRGDVRSDAYVPAPPHPEQTAYVLYTSGSTGRPKGVVIPHRGIVRLVAGAHHYLDLGPGHTFLQLSPLSFDASVLEVWGSLCTGTTLVLDKPGRLLEGMSHIIARHGVTTMLLISPQFALLCDREPETLAAVSQIMVGGDVVSRTRFRAFMAAHPEVRLSACYGPTETTLFASVFPATEVVDTTSSVPIGRAIENTQLYVTDGDLTLCPSNVEGELLIGGAGLARGYHRMPALTAERFVPDPFGPPGGRLYRSGDLVRRLPSGDLEFLGRRDEQVKIRGFRVETGDVEAAFLAHPDVAACIALPHESQRGSVLVAYVVLQGSDPDVDVVRRFVALRLPDYMLPSLVVPIEEVPLTANNKVDRKALAAMVGDDVLAEDVNGSDQREAAGPAMHDAIRDTWRRVLRVASVPVDQNLFEIGGSSLAAAEIVEETATLIGREVPVQLIFEHPTLEQFAAAVEALAGSGGDGSPAGLTYSA